MLTVHSRGGQAACMPHRLLALTIKCPCLRPMLGMTAFMFNVMLNIAGISIQAQEMSDRAQHLLELVLLTGPQPLPSCCKPVLGSSSAQPSAVCTSSRSRPSLPGFFAATF